MGRRGRGGPSVPPGPVWNDRDPESRLTVSPSSWSKTTSHKLSHRCPSFISGIPLPICPHSSTLLWCSLWCAEGWYESLRTTFASRRESQAPHLPPPFRSRQGDLNISFMKGLTATATRTRSPPNGTKPQNLTAVVLLPLYCHSRRSGLARSTVVSAHPPVNLY